MNLLFLHYQLLGLVFKKVLLQVKVLFQLLNLIALIIQISKLRLEKERIRDLLMVALLLVITLRKDLVLLAGRQVHFF